MYRVMVEENEERRNAGLPQLDSLPKPCDYFDLIGGTSTGGWALPHLDRYNKADSLSFHAE
jgi:hypothetical protein